MKSLLKSIILLFLLAACQQVQKVKDVIVKPTPRELYAREFEDYDLDFLLWQRSYEAAKMSQLQTKLPFHLNASVAGKSEALAYGLQLKEGERLVIRTTAALDSLEIFADLYRFENDSVLEEDPIIRKQWQADSLIYGVKKTGKYRLIVQPAIIDSASYHLMVYTLPSYTFPVAGKGNSAIQSFWGAPRDGGKRTHKGVDIFADRRTPVIAAVDGVIRSTGNRGLGGKQVWLRDGLLGKSLYYAHLDSIATSRGERVQVGDTLGFVGNTGNAKYTKPHLHFGIYGASGAVDPLPYIEKKDVPISKIEEQLTEGFTKLKVNQLRTGPSTTFEKLATLSKNQRLKLFGKSENWYHLEVDDSLQGFMHQSLIKLSN